MWGTLGSVCFVLRALHRLPSLSSIFTFCFPSFNLFSMTVFKREIICQSMLTWLKRLVIFFCTISKMQYVFWQYHRLVIFLYILQHACKFSSWLIVNSYFDHLRLASNLHPCRRIRATKCVQRTIALYQYKLLNLFPFSVIEFCEVVMFKPWTQYLWSKSGTLVFFSRGMRNFL